MYFLHGLSHNFSLFKGPFGEDDGSCLLTKPKRFRPFGQNLFELPDQESNLEPSG